MFSVVRDTPWGNAGEYPYAVYGSWKKPVEALGLQAALLTRKIPHGYTRNRFGTSVRVYFADLAEAQRFAAEAEGLV